jgi:phosphatidylserine/phosphatidylglycerophosphate/cardiolipin synthase-like enzyme
MRILRVISIFMAVMVISSCSSLQHKPAVTPFDAYSSLVATDRKQDPEGFIQYLYLARSWMPYKQLDEDPIALSKRSEAPVNEAYTRIIGPSYEDSIRSLAAKLWMIENAEHTLDLTYYIYKYDPTGQAILGALCNAVKRGVDIRIMVDSLGSFNMTHAPMRALETCAEDAGYIRDANGQETPYRARVQFVIINALTSARSWTNRRSHDKLIIKDGEFPSKDMVMTGGRNISVDYYGISKDGSRNKDTYLDLEMLLRSKSTAQGDLGKPLELEVTAGDVSSIYYTLLFLHKGNRRIYPVKNEDEGALGLVDPYEYHRIRAQESLAFIKGLPAVQEIYADMPAYASEGYRISEVRLAHELGNLVSEDVVDNVVDIKSRNTNSIGAIIVNIIHEADQEGEIKGSLKIVSPYLFIARYKDKEGQVIFDGAKEMIRMIDANPELTIEIITNSVLTSDNFYTQSVIDMDTAPRLLLPVELQEIWLKSRKDTELNPAFVNDPEWTRLVNHPRIRVYQTGKLDSKLLGGTETYGKLHAKFFFSEGFGFVGTSNFDYRSRLYNNEMGFYYLDPDLSSDLSRTFEELKSISLRWGSPEWLEMRAKLIQTGSFKGFTTRTQRWRYKFLKNTGLIWLF